MSAQRNAGIDALKKGDFETARSLLESACAQHPSDFTAFSMLGGLYHMSKLDVEAVQTLRYALTLRPNVAQIHYNLAVSLERLGQTHDAVSHLSESLRLKPGYPLALGVMRRWVRAGKVPYDMAEKMGALSQDRIAPPFTSSPIKSSAPELYEVSNPIPEPAPLNYEMEEADDPVFKKEEKLTDIVHTPEIEEEAARTEYQVLNSGFEHPSEIYSYASEALSTEEEPIAASTSLGALTDIAQHTLTTLPEAALAADSDITDMHAEEPVIIDDPGIRSFFSSWEEANRSPDNCPVSQEQAVGRSDRYSLNEEIISPQEVPSPAFNEPEDSNDVIQIQNTELSMKTQRLMEPEIHEEPSVEEQDEDRDDSGSPPAAGGSMDQEVPGYPHAAASQDSSAEPREQTQPAEATDGSHSAKPPQQKAAFQNVKSPPAPVTEVEEVHHYHFDPIPCREATEAFRLAIIGLLLFPLGLLFGPLAISRAVLARRWIGSTTYLSGIRQANMAIVMGSIASIVSLTADYLFIRPIFKH